MPDDSVFLPTLAADRGQRQLALFVVLLSVASFVVIAPFAKLPLTPVWAFIPIYEAVLIINDLVTAVLLFGQFAMLRSKALLVLAAGYLFTALMTVAHALSFPGLFAPGGLLGAGAQSTAWLYMAWHGGFPLFVIAYAWYKDAPQRTMPGPLAAAPAIISSLAVVAALVLGLTALATAGHDLLPPIMQGNRYTPAMIVVVSGVWLLSLLALLVLWRKRPHSLLDLWLMVVMCAWLFDIALSAVLNQGRFDLGFYAGRIFGLLAATFVLVKLLLKNGVLYARLAELHGAEYRKNIDLERLHEQLKARERDHVAALEALHNKEEEIRAIVENLSDCVITIDRQGILRNANPALERIMGYAVDEAVGRNVSLLMPEPHNSQHVGYLERYLRTGEAHVIGTPREVVGRHKDGRPVPLELSVSEYTVRGEHYFIGTLRDISERKRFIAELTRARADAEQANGAKSAFLATMSHEIRTPMNGVVGIVELLTHSRLSEHQADLLQTISESAATLLGLIDDILDFSKIEAGRLEVEQAPVSIANLVEGLANSLITVALRRGVDLLLFISPDIPERVLADDVRLRQILYNLIGNAIKFSAGRPGYRGRVAIRAEVAATAPLRLRFSISDNGIGIAPEAIEHLFTPFTQAEVSTTRRFGGTGLGLAICQRLVTLMQGEIVVSSTPGSGSTFTVTLPFALADQQPLRSLLRLDGVHCVVIAGHDLAPQDLSAHLTHAGAQVVVAGDLEQAACHAAALDSPVIIYDAGHDGSPLDALRLAFATQPGVRYLILTRGQGRRARLEAPDAVSLDGDGMRRQSLLRAVAIAAGQASPEVVQDDIDDFRDEEVVAPSIAEARAAGRLILVAEDDEINQKVILRQLALLGYAAEIAGTGSEALRLWREGNYALLLTDLHMPEMDGYTLAATIRREEAGARRMPILALTANALRGEANRARAAGMDEYMTKPVQLGQLENALDKWLPGMAARPELPAPAVAKPAAGKRLVDVSVLTALVGDDKANLRRLLGIYLTSIRSACEELLPALATNDARGIGGIAHRLKASSRSVGALELGDLCAELENACRAGDQAAITAGSENFMAALAAVDTCVADLIEAT
ncbi:ATP-binding protein [Dechloromonas sp. A34]|uniref:ATP-binding protein n=1 Tax=Dechloromonas sp. A34 TaxID=447588 RepID=UPI0022494FD6|nr:ATP-binding protein [Dechloromonas sp. A34]